MDKPIKFAAWSGVITVTIVIMLSVIDFFLSIISPEITSSIHYGVIYIFFYSISSLFSIFFIYGFLVLSKKLDVSLLKVMSWIGIIFAILLTLGSFTLMFIYPFIDLDENSSDFAQYQNGEELPFIDSDAENQFSNDIEPFQDSGDDFLLGVTILLIIFAIIVFIFLLVIAYLILFGIGVIKLGKNVKYSTPAGILRIITGCLLIIPIFGWFLAIFTGIATYILEIMVLFSASSKYEK